MEKRIFIFLVCLVIVYSGCAMKREYVATTDVSTPKSDSVELAKGLPPVYGPLGRNDRAMRPLGQAFQRVDSLRNAKQLTVANLAPIRKVCSAAVLVSKCDLEVLKALIVSDWVPVVVIRSPVGPKHTRAVAGYDDMAGNIFIVDPMNFAKAKLSYSEFIKQWDDPRKSCVLIYSHSGTIDGIKNALAKYLPPEKAKSVIIRK